jgi:integrase
VLVSRSKSEKGKKRHHPAVPYNELPGLMTTLRKREGIAARALEFVILTCSRLDEARLATWEEIDLPNKTWTVPPHRIKTREEHRVPLSLRAVEILEALRAGGEGEHVFPGRGSVPVSDKSIREVLTGIRPGFSIHGMRSCFADWSIEATEHPREVREMALAHKVGTEVEQAYRRTKLFNRRRAIMDDWCAFCSGETATVLKFGRTG